MRSNQFKQMETILKSCSTFNIQIVMNYSGTNYESNLDKHRTIMTAQQGARFILIKLTRT
jgi:hypothetical protein